jgi:hypothetical protein
MSLHCVESSRSGDLPVGTSIVTRAETPPSAHLLIHAEYDAGEDEGYDRRHETRLQRLRAIHARGPRKGTQAPLSLQIDDLQGHRLHSLDDAGPVVEVRLPAGTYQVTVSLGKMRLKYTLTLLPGMSFDLYPRLAPDWP